MGQRANYILIENGQQSIHYNHWRANCIASDLYLGDERFVEFVRSCKSVDILLDEVWIEGCVIINTVNKTLYFWSFEFGASVGEFYLRQLGIKWEGWSIHLLYNRMYDVEEILNIDYISKQEKFPLPTCTIKDIFSDEVNEFGNSIIILKTENGIHVTQLGEVTINAVLNFGENVIGTLLSKEKCNLPNEEQDNVFGVLIIDVIKKEILIDRSEFGLWEQIHYYWNGYSFKMGDFGYIGTLRLAGMNIEKLVMPPDKVISEFANLIKLTESFDPVNLAKRLLRDDKNIKFNKDFFDSVSPKRTVFEKLKNRANKWLHAIRRQ